MANIIKIRNSGTTSSVPSSLSFGEIAINYFDGKLFYKNSSGTIIAVKLITQISGTANQITVSETSGAFTISIPTSPTLVTPVLGVATATSINSTTIPSSKTLVVTTDKLSVLAATTSAELAGVVSDETGSGALVFASSPTLAGTPTAPTAAVGTSTTQLATTAFVQAASPNPLTNSSFAAIILMDIGV